MLFDPFSRKGGEKELRERVCVACFLLLVCVCVCVCVLDREGSRVFASRVLGVA